MKETWKDAIKQVEAWQKKEKGEDPSDDDEDDEDGKNGKKPLFGKKKSNGKKDKVEINPEIEAENAKPVDDDDPRYADDENLPKNKKKKK